MRKNRKWYMGLLALLIIVCGILIYLQFFRGTTSPMLADKGSEEDISQETISNEENSVADGISNEKDNELDSEQKTQQKDINFLIFGRDVSLDETSDEDFVVETDLIILASVKNEGKSLEIMFIPPNTATAEEQELKKLYNLAGIDGLKNGVEQITGYEIHHYIGVDYEPFVKLIDVLGGVEVTIDESIELSKYGLIVKPGINKLNGEETLKLLRLKDHRTSVLKRIERQKLVLTAIYKRFNEIKNLSQFQNVSQAVLNIREKLETNIDGEQILNLLMTLSQGFDGFKVDILPGELIDGLWIVKKEF